VVLVGVMMLMLMMPCYTSERQQQYCLNLQRREAAAATISLMCSLGNHKDGQHHMLHWTAHLHRQQPAYSNGSHWQLFLGKCTQLPCQG
jgi:hypothetical protein